ncbi:MAG: ParB/RepB/Spo0J family partition protein [Candidatus Hodarchaeota archaeon]
MKKYQIKKLFKKFTDEQVDEFMLRKYNIKRTKFSRDFAFLLFQKKIRQEINYLHFKFETQINKQSLHEVDVDLIRYDDSVDDYLRSSIQVIGLMNPIHLMARDGFFKCVDGARRLKACKKLNYPKISAYVYAGDYDDELIMNLIFSVNRKPTQKGIVIKAALNEFVAKGRIGQIFLESEFYGEYSFEMYSIIESLTGILIEDQKFYVNLLGKSDNVKRAVNSGLLNKYDLERYKEELV